MSDATPIPRPRRWLPPLIRLLSHLPLTLLYLIANFLFVILYYLLRSQRRLVVDNLTQAFPRASSPEIQRLAARSYRNALHVLFETVKARRLARTQLSQRVIIENSQVIGELLRNHATVITVAAHQGNWEWLQLACAAQLPAPLAALYKPVGDTGIDLLLKRMRGRFDSHLIPAATALPEILAFARQGGIIALVADQGPRPEEDKYWSGFLGRDTAFFPGLEKIAWLLHAPVVFVAMQRTGKGRYRIRFEPLAQPPYTQDTGEIMEPYIQRVERQVRDAPQDWLWVYKRWKYEKSLYDD